MFLSIKNTGKLSEAEIDIKGITVMAGVNNTGKSTIGKVLFCLFNSFYKIDRQLERERRDSISRVIETEYHTRNDLYNSSYEVENTADVIAESILQKLHIYRSGNELLRDDLRDLFTQAGKDYKALLNERSLSKILDKIYIILGITDMNIYTTILHRLLQDEFDMQINNIYTPALSSEFILRIKDKEVKVEIKDNSVQNVSCLMNLNTQVFYLDDPNVLDGARYLNNRRNHREHLRIKLYTRYRGKGMGKGAIDQIIISRRLDTIFEKLDKICNGEVIRKPDSARFGLAYKDGDTDAVIDIKNLSSGIKTFAILKTLLQNGSLTENGTIILDEPEIHLHPEWQINFAELIVLLQKEFNMHILINTHSPYFLDAIDVYSRKYGIADKCKYYLAEDTGKTSAITDVSDNIEKIYEKLSRPFQVLENERYNDDGL